MEDQAIKGNVFFFNPSVAQIRGSVDGRDESFRLVCRSLFFGLRYRKEFDNSHFQIIPKSLDSLRYCMQFIHNGIKNINTAFRKDCIERLYRRDLSWYNYFFIYDSWFSL